MTKPSTQRRHRLARTSAQSEQTLRCMRFLDSLYITPNWQRRLWSDWTDAQADHRRTHRIYCWFCRTRAQMMFKYGSIKWATSRENLSDAICEQQRRRSACASAQQSAHPCSLIGPFVVRCLDIHILAKFNLSRLSVAEQGGLSLTWSQTP